MNGWMLRELQMGAHFRCALRVILMVLLWFFPQAQGIRPIGLAAVLYEFAYCV